MIESLSSARHSTQRLRRIEDLEPRLFSSEIKCNYIRE